MKCKIFMSFILISSIFHLQAKAKIENNTEELHNKTAEIDIGFSFFNKKKANIHLRIPSQQAYGFEGKSTTPEQEEIVNRVIDQFKSDISNIILLGENCTYEVGGIEKFANASESSYQYKKGETKKMKTDYFVFESDIHINCNRDLKNEKIGLNFEKSFKGISRISIRLNATHKRNFVINNSNGNFNF